MRRYIIIVSLAVLVLCLYRSVSLATDKIEFKCVYAPTTHYRIEETSSNHMTMRLENPPIMREELNNQFPASMEINGDKVIEQIAAHSPC